MTQDELAIIAGAKHRIETVLSTNEGVLENARSHATPRDVPTKLEFDGDSVIVEIFGHKAFSSSRVVRAGNDFYMEYQFVRSEERRVGKECRCRRGTEHGNKK